MIPKLSIITVNRNNNKESTNKPTSIKQQSFYEHIIIDAEIKDGSQNAIEQYAANNSHIILGISEID